MDVLILYFKELKRVGHTLHTKEIIKDLMLSSQMHLINL